MSRRGGTLRFNSQTLLVSAGLAAVVGLGVWLALARHVSPTSSQAGSLLTPGLIVAEQDLDFGEVWAQGAFPWTVTLLNPTDRDITLVELSASRDCTDVDKAPRIIPAGGAADVALSLDLGPPAEERQKPVRDFSVRLRPTVSIDEHRQSGSEVELRGRVRNPVLVPGGEIDLGDSLVAGTEYPPTVVPMLVLSRLTDIEVDCDPAVASVSLQPQQIEEGEYRVWHLVLAPARTLPLGITESAVALSGVAGLEGRIPEFRIPLRANVANDLHAVPRQVNLGACPLGSSAEETVVLQSRTRSEFGVESITGGSEDLRITPLSDSPGAGPVFRIRRRITATGQRSDTVKFIVGIEGRRTVEILLAVTYYGVDARFRGAENPRAESSQTRQGAE